MSDAILDFVRYLCQKALVAAAFSRRGWRRFAFAFVTIGIRVVFRHDVLGVRPTAHDPGIAVPRRGAHGQVAESPAVFPSGFVLVSTFKVCVDACAHLFSQ